MSDDNKSKPENPGNKQDEDAIAFMQGLFELAKTNEAEQALERLT